MTTASASKTGVLHCVLLFVSLRYAHGCPSQCRCRQVPGGGRVDCPPGLTSFPMGLNPDTAALNLFGTPTPRGGSNIPALRQSDLSSLTSLVELSLPFANLTEIQDNALGVLASLRRLTLHDNKLRRVSAQTFSGLKNLTYLDLTDNEGCVLQGDDVFSSLTAMKTLYLGGLGLRDVKSLWFRALLSLESLDLHGNRIVNLDAGFLQGLVHVKLLDLTGNALQTLTPALRPTLTAIPVFFLADNPWHCNCELRWFKQLRRPRHSGNPVMCLTPQPLSLRQVARVPDVELVCVPPRILRCGGPYDVIEGSDVTVECDVEGDPFPVTEWAVAGGAVVDTVQPGPFTTPQRSVNSTAVTAADFAVHQGQWTVTARSSQGSVTENFEVNVFTTTTTTTTTSTMATTSAASTRMESKTTQAPIASPGAGQLTSAGVWFYVALAAFGFSTLALVSLILVAAVKVRKNQRQVGMDRRESRLSLVSGTGTDVTVLPQPSIDHRFV